MHWSLVIYHRQAQVADKSPEETWKHRATSIERERVYAKLSWWNCAKRLFSTISALQLSAFWLVTTGLNSYSTSGWIVKTCCSERYTARSLYRSAALPEKTRIWHKKTPEIWEVCGEGCHWCQIGPNGYMRGLDAMFAQYVLPGNCCCSVFAMTEVTSSHSSFGLCRCLI